MALRATLSRRPPLQLPEWLDCISRHPELLEQRRESREVPNPFKPGETIVMESKPGDALLLDKGVPLGAIGPSDYFEDDHELLFWSTDELFHPAKVVAIKVARLLSARVEWVDDD